MAIAAPHLAFEAQHCRLRRLIRHLRRTIGDCGASFGICAAPLAIAAPHLAFEAHHWRLRRLIRHLRHTIGDCGASSGICAAPLAIAAPHSAFAPHHWRNADEVHIRIRKRNHCRKQTNLSNSARASSIPKLQGGGPATAANSFIKGGCSPLKSNLCSFR